MNSLRLVYSNDRVAALSKQGERQEVEEVEEVRRVHFFAHKAELNDCYV